MSIRYNGHNIDLTDSLKKLIEEKSAKLQKHFHEATNLTVTLSLEGNQHIAEGLVSVINKVECHAVGESDDMYQSIDLMINKLDKQLIKHKEKR